MEKKMDKEIELYILVNSKQEWICKNYSRVYFSDKDIRNMNTYKYKLNAQKRLDDVHYWKYRHLDVSDIRIIKARIIMDFKEYIE